MLLFVFVIDCMQMCFRVQMVQVVIVVERMLVVDRVQMLAVVLVYPGVPVGHPPAIDVVPYLVTVYVFFYMRMRAVVPVFYVVLVPLDVGFRTVVAVFVVVPMVLFVQVPSIVLVSGIVPVVFYVSVQFYMPDVFVVQVFPVVPVAPDMPVSSYALTVPDMLMFFVVAMDVGMLSVVPPAVFPSVFPRMPVGFAFIPVPDMFFTAFMPDFMLLAV